MKIKQIEYSNEFPNFLLIVVSSLIVFNLTTCKVLGIGESKNDAEGKLQVKITYSDNVDSSSFFELSNEDGLRYLDLGAPEALNGIWKGSYNLNEDSVYWVNPEVEKNQILNSISLGDYKLSLKIISDEHKVNDLVILQDKLNYGPVNVKIVKSKQINYWTKALNQNWVEVIKGKILRSNVSSLYTEFRTTVYDKGIPIYAFQGKTVLVKDQLN